MTTSIASTEFAALLSPLSPRPPVAAAVSGGADSVALALLVQQAGIPFTALTVDHGLQESSAATAAQVSAWMQARGIPHTTLRCQPEHGRANLQARAREARYGLMREWCRAHGVTDLLTAHHRDDQAETLLLRLKRGSHITGLAGMAPVQEMEGIRLLRPLLSVPKTRLIATLNAHNQPWVEDATNALPLYERNRLRQLLHTLPDYERHVKLLAESAVTLRQLREKEEARLAPARDACIHLAPDRTIELRATAFNALPNADATLVLSHVLTHFTGSAYPPRFAQAEAALARMKTERRTTLHGCLITWVNRETLWRITPEKAEATLEDGRVMPHIEEES